MKNVSFVFLALLAFASCSEEGEKPIAVESVSLRSTASVAVNSTHELKATFSPENATDKSLTWTTDKPDIATVDENGVVTGKATGKAIITATSKSGSDKSARCEVEVMKEKTASITIAPANPVVAKEGTLTLRAGVSPADAAQSVTWRSGDPDKATIDPATGLVTGVEPGTTLITATATDGSGVTGQVTLTVQNKTEDSANAFITAIELGTEKFSVRVPDEGTTITVSHIPRTVGDITRIAVKITTGVAEATIQAGTEAFTQEQPVDFSNAVTFTVTAPNGTTVKNYTVAITPYNKDSNPYGIYTVKHLVDVANGLGNSYLLQNDLNLPNIEAADAVELTGISDYATNGWLPLGFYSGELFNGGGHSINNFYVNRSGERTGLFEVLDNWTASIKNLGVNCRANTTSKGGRYTGILVGYNDQGVIDNCYTTGKIESYNAGSGESYAGGLVGHMEKGNINTGYSTADVSATGGGTSYAGGLVGFIEGDANAAPNLKNCYATGNISSSGGRGAASGGLLGWSRSGVDITNCYATGNLSSSRQGSATVNTGGLVGGSTYFQYGNVNPRNCYRNSNATLTKNNATVTEADDASNDKITPKTYEEMQTDAFKDLLKNGTDGSRWSREDGKNNNLPYIKDVGVGK